MTKVKICGLTSRQDIDIVNEAKPDYVGFVFAPSRRKVEIEQAKDLKKLLNPDIYSVGVFVQEPLQRIVDICRENIIDCVQLHGEESLEYVKELQKRITRPIIYARRLQPEQAMERFDSYPVDYLLFDTYVKDAYGGSGKLIDYSRIPKIKKPLFLAGGMNSENVSAAITEVHPYCVDVSSGVETEGKKDREKVLRFVQQVRAME